MGWLLEFMGRSLENLIPPPDAEPRSQWWHRVRVTIIACTAFLGLVALWAASFGMVPALFPGFARADELHASIAETRRHWSYDTESSLLELRERQCKATGPELRALLAESIQKRSTEYFNLTGRVYVAPACNDL